MIIIVLARVILNLFIVGLFLYSKLLPYKDRLLGQYRTLFQFFESVFGPVTQMFRKFIKPVQVGQNLFVDLSQVVLLVLFLLVYELI